MKKEKDKKEQDNSLIYHSLHGRNVQGCLPLFFLLAAIFITSMLWFMPVKREEPLRPKGLGTAYYRADELMQFIVKQRSLLPLQMPTRADPEFQEDITAAAMMQRRRVGLVPAPPQALLPTVPDSVVLDPAKMLELPPAKAAAEPQKDEEVPL